MEQLHERYENSSESPDARCPSGFDSFCHSFLIQLTCSHLLVAGVSFLSSFRPLHAPLIYAPPMLAHIPALASLPHCSSYASLPTLFPYTVHCPIYIGHICGSFCTCSACLIMTTEFHYPFEIRIVINLIYPYTDTYSAHKYSVDSVCQRSCLFPNNCGTSVRLCSLQIFTIF